MNEDTKGQGARPVSEDLRAVCWGLFVALWLLILWTLTRPPVAHSTEAARRTQCRNNLHQIGVALEAYHTDHECYPPAIAYGVDGEPMHSWTVYLLPHLDEADLYNAYNFALAHNASANSTVARTRVFQYMCPSAEGWERAECHYGMVGSPGGIGAATQPVRRADITDDPATTVLVAEMARTPCLWTAPRALVDLASGVSPAEKYPRGASSAHEGTVFALYADGAVRFLPEIRDRDALRALSTISGGEPMTAEDLDTIVEGAWQRREAERSPGLLRIVSVLLFALSWLVLPLLGALGTSRRWRSHPVWLTAVPWLLFLVIVTFNDSTAFGLVAMMTTAVVMWLGIIAHAVESGRIGDRPAARRATRVAIVFAAYVTIVAIGVAVHLDELLP